MVKDGGPDRNMFDFFLLRVWGCESRCRLLGRPDVLRLRRDFLCAKVLDRLSVARMEAVISGDGGSPKMKNLMKAAIRRTMEIWPRMKPCVNENLGHGFSQIPARKLGQFMEIGAYVGSGRIGHTSEAIFSQELVLNMDVVYVLLCLTPCAVGGMQRLQYTESTTYVPGNEVRNAGTCPELLSYRRGALS